MLKVDRPKAKALDVFKSCVSIIEDPALKARFKSVEAIIEDAATAYESAADESNLFTIPIQNDVSGIISKAEMAALYTTRMVRKSTPGRVYYDQIIGAPKHDRCPLCAQRTVSTLDHYLPKALYPALAVTPDNLVPSCGDCNKIKKAVQIHAQDEQTLHPYFDEIGDAIWLQAVLTESTSPTLKYRVGDVLGWTDLMVNRMKEHFKTFELGRLYCSHSAVELINIKLSLRRTYDAAGADAVRSHLQMQAESYAASNPNSWQSAMYRCLTASDWFCGGGFS